MTGSRHDRRDRRAGRALPGRDHRAARRRRGPGRRHADQSWRCRADDEGGAARARVRRLLLPDPVRRVVDETRLRLLRGDLRKRRPLDPARTRRPTTSRTSARTSPTSTPPGPVSRSATATPRCSPAPTRPGASESSRLCPRASPGAAPAGAALVRQTPPGGPAGLGPDAHRRDGRASPGWRGAAPAARSRAPSTAPTPGACTATTTVSGSSTWTGAAEVVAGVRRLAGGGSGTATPGCTAASTVPCPVLVLSSDRSALAGATGDTVHSHDLVLDVEHIRRWATAIGRHVTYVRSPGPGTTWLLQRARVAGAGLRRQRSWGGVRWPRPATSDAGGGRPA